MAHSYLVLGHITEDVTAAGRQVGGTAIYAAEAAAELGCHARIVTSMSGARDLANVELAVVLAPVSTTFEYTWGGDKRVQCLTQRARPLHFEDVPPEWRESSIWHLGPVAGEIDESIVESIPDSSFVGVTPQGWLREVGPDSIVRPRDWTEAGRIVSGADALVLSHEDLPDAHAVALEWSRQGPVVAVTAGSSGSTVFVGGESTHIDPFPIDATSDLGAGDVFAAAFFVRLSNGDPPADAGRFASAAAAQSLLSPGPDHPPQLNDIQRLLQTA